MKTVKKDEDLTAHLWKLRKNRQLFDRTKEKKSYFRPSSYMCSWCCHGSHTIWKCNSQNGFHRSWLMNTQTNRSKKRWLCPCPLFLPRYRRRPDNNMGAKAINKIKFWILHDMIHFFFFFFFFVDQIPWYISYSIPSHPIKDNNPQRILYFLRKA